MKRAIICGVCEKPVRESDTYAVKLTDYTKNEFTVEGKDKSGKAEIKYVYPPRVIRVCRKCIKKMGYKVGGLKVKKTEVKNAQQ